MSDKFYRTQDRWKFEQKDFMLTATPALDEMMSYVSQAVKELTHKINAHEEFLILQAMDTASLLKLRNSIDKLLFKRQNPDSEFKSL